MRNLKSTIRNPQSAIAKVVVICASAGGIAPLTEFFSALPGDLPAAFIVVQHLKAEHKTGLHKILGRKSPLRFRLAESGIPLEKGVVYIANPGQHLLVEGDILVQNLEEPVHYVRPSADVLFTSVADVFGANVIGIVLSGTGHDGAYGCAKIKEKGGTTIAQDEETSAHFGMPKAAIEAGDIDYVLPIDEIGKKILDMLALH